MGAVRCKLHRLVSLGQHKILCIVGLVSELRNGCRNSHRNSRVRLRTRDKRRERCRERL
jgi:hypothetical protein